VCVFLDTFVVIAISVVCGLLFVCLFACVLFLLFAICGLLFCWNSFFDSEASDWDFQFPYWKVAVQELAALVQYGQQRPTSPPDGFGKLEPDEKASYMPDSPALAFVESSSLYAPIVQYIRSQMCSRPGEVALVTVQQEPMVKVEPDPVVTVQQEPDVTVQAEPEVTVQQEPDVKAEPEVTVQQEPLESVVTVQQEPEVKVEHQWPDPKRRRIRSMAELLESAVEPTSGKGVMGIAGRHISGVHPGYATNVPLLSSPILTPPDHRCWYYCFVFGQNYDRCRALLQHPTGFFVESDDAIMMLREAISVRDSVIAKMRALGLHQQADRLLLPGSAGEPDEEDFVHFADFAGFAFEIVQPDLPDMQPLVYGDGRVAMWLQRVQISDPDGHPDGHLPLLFLFLLLLLLLFLLLLLLLLLLLCARAVAAAVVVVVVVVVLPPSVDTC
jgi:hypothetical protein